MSNGFAGKDKKRLRRVMGERQGGLCAYCAAPFGGERETDGYATIEHLISRKHGGGNDQGNVVLVHTSCNQLARHWRLAEKLRRLRAAGVVDMASIPCASDVAA